MGSFGTIDDAEAGKKKLDFRQQMYYCFPVGFAQ